MGDLFSHRPVLYPGGDNEQLAGAELHRVGTLHLYTELTVPAKEQFILLMGMPRELALEPSDSNNRIVNRNQISRLPRPIKRSDCLGYRH